MKLQDTDRDLVFMRHVFTLEKEGKRWEKTSTMVGVGASRSEKGFSFIQKTVGYTTAYGARLILDGKISLRGVISPIHKEIYEPVLADLDKDGIRCVEEDQQMPQPK
jgi:saccharopine dehydrogenase-like NADP-dependent oxidoreductase